MIPYNKGNKGYMPRARLAEIAGVPAEAISAEQYRLAAVLPFYTRSFRAATADGDARVVAEIAKAYNGERHRVYPYSFDNEKLEFHGDAVLRLILAEYLLREFPDKDEAFYTYVRINCEKKTSLALFSREWNIARYTILDKKNDALRSSMHVVEDVFEAFVSGLYYAFGYAVAQGFIERTLERTKLAFVEDTNYKNKIIAAGAVAKSTTVTFTMPPAIAGIMSGGRERKGVLFYDRRTGRCIGAATGSSAKMANEAASRQAAEFVEAAARASAPDPAPEVRRFEAAYAEYRGRGSAEAGRGRSPEKAGRDRSPEKAGRGRSPEKAGRDREPAKARGSGGAKRGRRAARPKKAGRRGK